MKLLFDQNLSFKLCGQLSDIFPDSSQVQRLGLARAADQTIWDCAKSGGYVLVSHDADFAEIAVLLGPPPKLIWMRTGNQPTSVIADLLRARIVTIQAFDSDPTASCLEIY